MSFDSPSPRPCSLSPSGSGRDSPVPARRVSRRHIDEGLRSKDKNYRRYASGIERALSLFDTPRLEWPDYISFLGRLLKAIQGHPAEIDSLPHKITVSDRLAQCLSPTLPSGVHQKALEVYSHIFTLIGKDALAHDLPVYLPGLVPVLSFASLSIRPLFLDLLEAHILKLGNLALRPAIKTLILCLLPGLEDETSEDFDRSLSILDGIRKASNANASELDTQHQGFGDEYFWQCLFLASLSSSSRRSGALAYLVRRLPRLGPQTSSTNGTQISNDELPYIAESVVSPEPGLLIRCFASGLNDEQVLLQRGFLDLLLSHLPLNSPVLIQRVDAEDLQRLVTAATSVVARRDMSLNRRLWTWFLGPSASDEGTDQSQNVAILSPSTSASAPASQSITYFTQYGLEPLTKSILSMFGQVKDNSIDQARPYRICLSLMDRWEIGGVLVSRIFIPAIEGLSSYKRMAPSAGFQDVLRSASSFFDGIESGIIWGQMKQLVVSALGHAPLARETRQFKIDLIRFIIAHFQIREDEMVTFHMPLFVVETLILACQSEVYEHDGLLGCDEDTVLASLAVAEQLSTFMPEREHLNASFAITTAASENKLSEDIAREILRAIDSFYDKLGGNLALSPPPFSSQTIANLLLRYSTKILVQDLNLKRSLQRAQTSSHMTSNLIQKISDCQVLDSTQLLHCFRQVLSDPLETKTDVDFVRAVSIHQVLVKLISKAGSSIGALPLLDDVFIGLIERFWSYLNSASPKYHIESVRCLWELDNVNNEGCMLESSLSRFVANSGLTLQDTGDKVDSAQKFAVFWTHSTQNLLVGSKGSNAWSRRSSITFSSQNASERSSPHSVLFRPLLLWLDGLNAEDLELKQFLRSWLGDYSGIGVIIELITSKILELQQKSRANAGDPRQQYETNTQQGNQSSECLYYTQLLWKILEVPSDNVGPTLLTNRASQASHDIAAESHDCLQTDIAQLCLYLVRQYRTSDEVVAVPQKVHVAIQQHALSIMQQLLATPDPSLLQSLGLDDDLVDILGALLDEHYQQIAIITVLLDTTLGYLKLKYLKVESETERFHRRNTSVDAIKNLAGRQVDVSATDLQTKGTSQVPHPPKKLFRCLQDGLSCPAPAYVLDKWVRFLIDVLPLYAGSLFQNLMPLVETFCKQIKLSFEFLKATFTSREMGHTGAPDQALLSLLTGLEYVLSSAHDRLVIDESSGSATKSPELPSQGFFGNIASGVFSSDANKGRSTTANSRLTVILSLQDAIHLGSSIWSWASYGQDSSDFDTLNSTSFAYISLRLRGRSKQLLDRLFAAELLESLETLIVSWKQQHHPGKDAMRSMSHVIDLLHVLDGSKPKLTMPALFNALYSRTNPNALEGSQKSSLTSGLADLDIAEFLIEYSQSLDDDAMDEIWTDCMTFLKDVLSNPMSHSHVLPCLLMFLLTLAEKVENTNFGEQRRMRKELTDLFLRLLTATFTSRPSATLQEDTHGPSPYSKSNIDGAFISATSLSIRNASVLDILAAIVHRFNVILSENDKLANAATAILSNAISPIIHAKAFPENVGLAWFTLMHSLMKIPQASKIWRKEAADIFNHPRLFSCPAALVAEGLMPVVRQWATNEKDKIPDTLARVAQPTSAGIMFGVGASAARIEADKKTQLCLRRAALLVLSLDNDSFANHHSSIQEKIIELLGASPASSPSSATRPELYMLLQAIILKTASVHLAPLWPPIISELQKCLGAALPRTKDYDTYNTLSLLQACKLLDLLLMIGPDDFQMHEWLFITDTIDAVYRPGQWEPVGLVDEIAEDLSSGGPTQSPHAQQSPFMDAGNNRSGYSKGPLLRARGKVAEMSKDDFVRSVLGPFFTQLSVHSFEATYSLAEPDLDVCKQALLEDLFDDGTIMG